jgi:hypothetical protein
MAKRIRLMDGYGAKWPVWTDLGQEDRAEWALPLALKSRLREWAREFDLHFEVFRGWDDPMKELSHREEGQELRAELTSVLGPEYDVVLILLEGGHAPL